MKAIFVAGLLFGDEGKGSIVDFLTRTTGSKLVVRYNGGAQAGHNVVLSDGKEHCFSQWGSGTLAGARTYLSQFMMIDPAALLNEAKHLSEVGCLDPFGLLTIHPDAPILTPYHRTMNRLRELNRGTRRHGSCGMGIGELGADIAAGREVLTIGELLTNPNNAMRILRDIRQRYETETSEIIEDVSQRWLSSVESLCYLIRLQDGFTHSVFHMQDGRISESPPAPETVIFEGAQGVLLDEKYGFHPHTTWSNCTFDSAHSLWEDNGGSPEDIHKIGVTRCYATRHGQGPFPTEKFGPSGLHAEHNTLHPWQGEFRIGHLDLELLQYSLRILKGVDELALTCLDDLSSPWFAAQDYRYQDDALLLPHCRENTTLEQQRLLGKSLYHVHPLYMHGDSQAELISCIERKLDTRVGIKSYGPTPGDKLGWRKKE